MTAPKSPRDEWKAIVDFAESADAEAVAEMSEAEVDAELAQAGFDVAAETAKGKAEHDAAVRAAARRAAPPRRRPGVSAWLAAPAAALVSAGSWLLMAESAVLVGQARPDAATDGAIDSGDGGPDGDGR